VFFSTRVIGGQAKGRNSDTRLELAPELVHRPDKPAGVQVM
jgi:hypothetical protein